MEGPNCIHGYGILLDFSLEVRSRLESKKPVPLFTCTRLYLVLRGLRQLEAEGESVGLADHQPVPPGVQPEARVEEAARPRTVQAGPELEVDILVVHLEHLGLAGRD